MGCAVALKQTKAAAKAQTAAATWTALAAVALAVPQEEDASTIATAAPECVEWGAALEVF